MFGKSKKPKYYSLSGILEKNADYNIISVNVQTVRLMPVWLT